MAEPPGGERWPATGTALCRLVPETGLGDDGERLMADLVLAPEERARWEILQETALPRRCRQWLLGRWAVKQAARDWFARRDHALPGWDQMVIDHLPGGQPRIAVAGHTEVPAISIAHTEGAALGAAADGTVGADLERLGHIRSEPDAFARLAFAESEVRLLPSAAAAEAWQRQALRLWCAKEAAAKALGSGLQGRPRAFVVEWLDGEAGEVRFERHRLSVRLAERADWIAALATWDH